MLTFEDVADAITGEERDALMRAFAADLMEASRRQRGGRRSVSVERPRDPDAIERLNIEADRLATEPVRYT